MRASREGMTLAGSILAAITASACCIGPVVLALIGVGGAAVAMKLEPYRPVFIVVTLVFLGAAFFFVYRRPADCGPDDSCGNASRRTGLKVVLWLVTLFSLGALAFPYYVGFFV